jgi:rsbT co-antagonist protein RsbR
MSHEDERAVLELLRSDRTAALRLWVAAAEQPLRGRFAHPELERLCGELLDALTAAVEVGGLDVMGEAYQGVRAILSEQSRDWARRGFSPSETASSVFALKEALFEIAQRMDSALSSVLLVSRWVDGLGLWTFESFAQARERVIVEQAEQLLELTTPVVKLWDGVLAVPLIGTLDSARTQIVMEKLLQTLIDTGSEQAIIDITGVPAVDTEVAQHLLKTVVAARLMGAECIISGIRPQIAQTIVALGIEFGDIPTKASLADALRYSLRSSGVEIVQRRRERSV